MWSYSPHVHCRGPHGSWQWPGTYIAPGHLQPSWRCMPWAHIHFGTDHNMACSCNNSYSTFHWVTFIHSKACIRILKWNRCYQTLVYLRCLWLKRLPTIHDDVMTWKRFSRCWYFLGNSTVTAAFPSQRISDAEMWCFFVVSPNKRLKKFRLSMMTSSNGNIFRVTGPLCGNSPHKGPWRGALMYSLICVWINDWVNNRETGDLGRQRCHYDVIVMQWFELSWGLCDVTEML